MTDTMHSTIKSILTELQQALDRFYAGNAPHVLLYGSYARNEATEASDIDVLLLYSYPVVASKEIQRVSPLLAELNLRYQVLISILPVAEADYRSSEDSFYRNVKREGILVDAL